MRYFEITFQWSESTYCANIAHAENENDVRNHYRKYNIISVKPASDYDVEDAKRRGKPIIEC